MPQDGTVAKAFELARSGSYRTVDDLRKRLESEGYSSVREHLAGTSIKKQLVELMKQHV